MGARREQLAHLTGREVCPNLLPLLFLEEPVECAACVLRIAGSGGTHWRCGRRPISRAFSRHGYPRRKQCALVPFVFHGDAHGNRLHALKAGGWLEMGALFAAVQFRMALRTHTAEIRVGRQGCGAVEAARSGHVLDQAWEAWPGDAPAAAPIQYPQGR